MTGDDHADEPAAGDDSPTDLEPDGGSDGSETEEVHGYEVDEEPPATPDTTATDVAEDADAVGPESDAGELRTTTDVVESPVVKTAARTITPFVVAFGIYLTLFGTSLPGGAFQGGVVMATSIVLIAMAFGFGPTQEWLEARALAGLFLLGAGIFGAVAFGAIALGGDVLPLVVDPETGVPLWPVSVEDMVKLVEVAIAALVAGVIIGLVVWLAAGFEKGGESI